MEEKTIYQHSTIAEIPNGIILGEYKKVLDSESTYQSEKELEDRLIKDLVEQGYEYIRFKNNDELYANLKNKLERLNDITFNPSEWRRFLVEYLDSPNDGMIEKTRKIQEDYIYDFTFDDGVLKNIKLIDKKNVNNNFLQVTNQVTQVGKYENRYDVSILVNGLPLVHIELKQRGAALREAFDQIHRYTTESFNKEHSLYKFVQIFIISNGTYTRYFANTTAESKKNYEFTCEWADYKNNTIKDLRDFTATFLEKRTLLEVLNKYCVFDASNTLLIMRPYQIAATERILWKINTAYNAKKWGTINSGGFIWHTTGSGKTLTSFKAARLATKLEYIDKVFFIVDRKDLDYQTMKEYQKFQKDSVNGSKDTRELKKNIEKKDSRIVVTTIQKLNEFIKQNPKHEIYDKHCVLIYDECHRSQFGRTQKEITKKFKKYYQFGFTGTPIFPENALGHETTAGVFGSQIHAYVLTDAIRDGKVLKFKVDYNNIDVEFKKAEEDIVNEDEDETEEDKSLNLTEEQRKALEKEILLHPKRIEKISKYILEMYNEKTHRNKYYNIQEKRLNGFNAMFAVQSIEAAKKYYLELKKQQIGLSEEEKLKIATIFSYAPNEKQKLTKSAKGEIDEEGFDTSLLDVSAKEFLASTIKDYNRYFKTNYNVKGGDFQNYYKDLSNRVKNKEVDLLIVVGMFLTGFDAPTLNTLFVDKNLRYHGLIQAFSRTNRIINQLKPFGNIVCFRDLEKNTKDAIKLFGDENSINVILEKSYKDYLEGYVDKETGKYKKGYKDVCSELVTKFPDPTIIEKDKDKREFIKLFGEYLKIKNILRNYDEFQNYEPIIPERKEQDMRSVYIELKQNPTSPIEQNEEIANVDFSDLEFHIDLLKTDEINLDYILELIHEKTNEFENADILEEDIRRLIKSSLGVRAKEELIISFMNNVDIKKYKTKNEFLDSFYKYARVRRDEKVEDILKAEYVNYLPARKYIKKALKKGYADPYGTDLDESVTGSRMKGERQKNKESLLTKVRRLIEEFIGI